MNTKNTQDREDLALKTWFEENAAHLEGSASAFKILTLWEAHRRAQRSSAPAIAGEEDPHSPTPWVHATDIGQVGSIELPDGTVIAQTQQLVGDVRSRIRQGNAAHIVKCVNAYATLQAPVDSGCPCLNGRPCQPRCTCLMPLSSSGCLHCCRYGSAEQREFAADRIANALKR